MQDEVEVVAREIIAYAMDDSQCWDSANQKWIVYRSKLLQWGAALESAALRQRPVVDDARMARALEWVRAECVVYSNPEARTHLPAIEEAIAACQQDNGGK